MYHAFKKAHCNNTCVLLLCETTTVLVLFVTLKVLYCSLYRCVLRRQVVCLCSVLFEFSTVEDIFNDRRRQEEWTNRRVIFLESWLLFAYFALINGKDYGIGTLHYTYRTTTAIHLHAPFPIRNMRPVSIRETGGGLSTVSDDRPVPSTSAPKIRSAVSLKTLHRA